LFSAAEPGPAAEPGCEPMAPDIAGSQAAGMVLTGCPAALTPSLEMIQAPGWPGTTLAVTTSLGLARRLTFAPVAAIVVTV
jgi:hypothetical protein